MKLRTKFQDENFERGEIVKAKVNTYYDENKVVVMADKARGGISRFEYNSIKDFTDHWTDAPEEPKEYYYINNFGVVQSEEVGKAVANERIRKEIGNYFETEEEAEKAVEKLKAIKRLKDKGFRFETFNFDRQMVTNGRVNLLIKATYNVGFIDDSVKLSDLELLFGGEE